MDLFGRVVPTPHPVLTSIDLMAHPVHIASMVALFLCSLYISEHLANRHPIPSHTSDANKDTHQLRDE